MGSSTGAHYGRAMMIYTEITKASAVLSANPLAMTQTDAVWDDRSQASKAVLYRLAIGTAVTFSVPDVPYRFTQSVTPPWGPAADPAMSKFIDPVARYMDYECAYLGGLLDPAFEVLTALEMGQSDTHYESKWPASNTWIRDVFCYPYAQDKCPIMSQRLVHDRALVLGVSIPASLVPGIPTVPSKTRLESRFCDEKKKFQPCFIYDSFFSGHAVSTDATSEDLAWVRDTMLNYDPSLIAAEGLNGWRYNHT